MKALIGKKIGMTQVFTPEGKMIAVTAIQVTPNIVVAHKTTDKDGYEAVVLGFDTKGKHVSKPLAGQIKAAGIEKPVTMLKEFPVSGEAPAITSEITVGIFAPGDIIDVSGTSKGKGFQGVIKRHNFSRGPETHGSDHHRSPGSIGSAFPERVVKGKKMPGHMGSERVTIKKLQVVEVHADKNILLVKGAIPGSRGSVVEVRGTENV
jgi:large subunit ribosomal protein L3